MQGDNPYKTKGGDELDHDSIEPEHMDFEDDQVLDPVQFSNRLMNQTPWVDQESDNPPDEEKVDKVIDAIPKGTGGSIKSSLP